MGTGVHSGVSLLGAWLGALALSVPAGAASSPIDYTCAPDGSLESYQLPDRPEVRFKGNPVHQLDLLSER